LVYDCFTFFNELDLLELRLHELSDSLDYFVLVEATRTHSNQPKPLYFDENRERFSEFLPKIIHIIVDDFPESPEDRWVLENYQRNAIMRGLQNCKPDDSIIISDVDEIVRYDSVDKYKNHPGIKFFLQDMFYYYFNCKTIGITWKAVKMVHFKDLISPQWLRSYPAPLGNPSFIERKYAKMKHEIRKIIRLDTYIHNGGWHFSYLGGIEKIRTKINSFAHEEFDRDSFTNNDNILRAIQKGEDLFDREDIKLKFVEIDNTFPRYLSENMDKFSSMIRYMDR